MSTPCARQSSLGRLKSSIARIPLSRRDFDQTCRKSLGPAELARGWADLIHQYAVKDAGHAALIGRIRSEEMYVQVLSAFQATPRKTIIAENSIHTIKPIAAASPP
jgi:hypothetical protein